MIEQWNKERELGESTKSYNSSPGERRNRSPVREGSAERRAKIEQWNWERELAESGKSSSNITINNDNVDGGEKVGLLPHDDYQ